MEIENGKLKTYELDPIVITDKEVEFIKHYKNFNHENMKLRLFLLLVIAKATKTHNQQVHGVPNDGFYFFTENLNDYVDLVDTEEKRKGVYLMRWVSAQFGNVRDRIYENIEIFAGWSYGLYEHEFRGEKYKVLYADDSTDGYTFTIDEAVDYYRYLIEDKDYPYRNCVVCGKEFRKTNNKQKYCKDCLKDVRRVQVREAARRFRACRHNEA